MRTRSVRILVGAHKKVIFGRLRRLTHAIDLVEDVEACTEGPLECLELLVGSPVRHQRDRTTCLLDKEPGLLDRNGEVGRLSFEHRLLGTRAFEECSEIASDVAHPWPIDRRIFERRDALDHDISQRVNRVQLPLGLAVPQLDRAAARAARAYGRRGLQIPDARLVEKRARQKCADRTYINDVVRVHVLVKRSVLGGAHQ